MAIPNSVFSGELIIKDKKRALLKAKPRKAYIKLWYDGSKLDKSSIGAAIVWKDYITQKWQKLKLCPDLNKEIFDAKIWCVFEAFKIVEKITKQV